jgi:hypothetical protein
VDSLEEMVGSLDVERRLQGHFVFAYEISGREHGVRGITCYFRLIMMIARMMTMLPS